jgi:hypothetical protein
MAARESEWQRVQDAQGRFFYVNHATREVGVLSCRLGRYEEADDVVGRGDRRRGRCRRRSRCRRDGRS